MHTDQAKIFKLYLSMIFKKLGFVLQMLIEKTFNCADRFFYINKKEATYSRNTV